MNTTSIAGSTLTARSISTASVIDAATHRCGWNDSTAQRMIAPADSCSNFSLSSASSASVRSSTCRRLIDPPSGTRALAGADLGHVGPGLVEVDVEVGLLVRRGEQVEVLELLGDGLGPAGPLQPLRERL